MPAFVFEREQLLNTTLEDAWGFFSTPRNLARITPPSLGFRTEESFNDAPAHNGQLIAYTVRPLFGVPLKWVTRIEEVKAPFRFTDSQIKGPYRSWHHLHTFTEVPGGVQTKDRVEYELPFGRLGELLHAPLIRPRLNRIFDYRSRALGRIFPHTGRTRSR